MSKFTTELRFIPVNEIFDFDFTMYGATPEAQAQHKAEFIERFYNYYFFDEINGDTVNEFNRWCERTMNEWLPLFNKRYAEQEALMSNNLLNKVRSFARTTHDTYAKNNSGSNSNTNTFLDTPQVPLGQTVDNYATNVTKDSGSYSGNDMGVGDGNETVSENETMKLPLEVWNDYYKYYRDLDMELIRKFKECFYVLY